MAHDPPSGLQEFGNLFSAWLETFYLFFKDNQIQSVLLLKRAFEKTKF